MAQEDSAIKTSGVVFDTDILIWYFRGNQKAGSFLDNVPHSKRTISSLTMMELIQGCRHKQEIQLLKNFIRENIAKILYPNEFCCLRAVRLIEQHSLSHGLRVVDSLIASSALEEDYSLASGNLKHYNIIAGLKLISFKP